jgi:proteasome assembly chaperone (PAC2) family protein
VPDSYQIYDHPPLRRPFFVMGLSGWPNAGEVATGAVTFLRDRLAAKRLAEIYPEEFFDFTLQRPVAVIEEGLVRRLRPPSNILYYHRNLQAENDLILLRGAEPHLRWTTFINSLLAILEEFGVGKVFALGGMYDRLPHNREPKVSGMANGPELKELLRSHGIEFSSYQGPSSLHTTFLTVCRRHNLPGVSIWGHVPVYVQTIANPKVCHAVLRRLTRMLDLDLDLSDLKRAGDYLDATLDGAMEQNDELRRFMGQLERETGRYPVERDQAPEPDAELIIKEVEDFLRRATGDNRQ